MFKWLLQYTVISIIFCGRLVVQLQSNNESIKLTAVRDLIFLLHLVVSWVFVQSLPHTDRSLLNTGTIFSYLSIKTTDTHVTYALGTWTIILYQTVQALTAVICFSWMYKWMTSHSRKIVYTYWYDDWKLFTKLVKNTFISFIQCTSQAKQLSNHRAKVGRRQHSSRRRIDVVTTQMTTRQLACPITLEDVLMATDQVSGTRHILNCYRTKTHELTATKFDTDSVNSGPPLPNLLQIC